MRERPGQRGDPTAEGQVLSGCSQSHQFAWSRVVSRPSAVRRRTMGNALADDPHRQRTASVSRSTPGGGGGVGRASGRGGWLPEGGSVGASVKMLWTTVGIARRPCESICGPSGCRSSCGRHTSTGSHESLGEGRDRDWDWAASTRPLGGLLKDLGQTVDRVGRGEPSTARDRAGRKREGHPSGGIAAARPPIQIQDSRFTIRQGQRYLTRIAASATPVPLSQLSSASGCPERAADNCEGGA